MLEGPAKGRVLGTVASVDRGGLWSRMDNHASGDGQMHKVAMAGKAYVHTDPTNLAGG